MPRASEVKRADVVELDGHLLIVREIEVQNPSARGAATLYKMRFSNVQTKLKHQQSFKGDDLLKTVDLTRHKVTYSYADGSEHVFMDSEDFSEYRFAAEDIAEELPFITEDIQGCQVLTVDGTPIGIELPQQVDLVIVDTPPPLKGASATSRSKPATFVTGLVIQVPDYLEAGVKVRIHTGERRYTGRSE
ncbi:MAG: elongation factor P-like protein YeiP [Pseudomonadota bacterium]